MSVTETRPRAYVPPTPELAALGGAPTPHPTMREPSPISPASGGATTSRQAEEPPTPKWPAPAGTDSHPTEAATAPGSGASGGAEAGQDPAAIAAPMPVGHSLLDPALALAADVLDDLERVRIANANRLRILTTSTADSDGEQRGFGLDESHPDVARLAAIVDMLGKVEHDATLNLQRHMRRHPLGPWAKSVRGVGEKQIARLLAAIGDPYIRPEIVREDGTVIPAGPRTVSALWAYCGLHVLPGDQLTCAPHERSVAGTGGDSGRALPDARHAGAGVAPKRARGQKANWSTTAKTKAYLIATSCLKQLVKPCTGEAHADDCQCSPYRVTYDRRRAHTAETHPEWNDGHSHNDALRVAAKAILRDLWREAKRIHEATE